MSNDSQANRIELEESFPFLSSIVLSGAVTFNDIQTALSDDETILLYIVGSKRAFVFAIRTAGISLFRLNVEPSSLLRNVNTVTQSIRLMRTDLPADIAHKLYSDLIRPVESKVADVKHLLIVTHGPLSLLPFTIPWSQKDHSRAKIGT
jgi:CHAT domain-containing protein